LSAGLEAVSLGKDLFVDTVFSHRLKSVETLDRLFYICSAFVEGADERLEEVVCSTFTSETAG